MNEYWLAVLLCGCAAGPLPRVPDPRPDRSCTADACEAAPRVVDPKAPASLWTEKFDGGTLKLPADQRADWFGLVVRGKLAVEGCGEIGEWQAFRAPGGGRTVRGEGIAVLGVAADKALGELDRLGATSFAPEKRAACETVDLKRLPDVAWGRRQSHARLAFRGGKAYFGLLYSDVGAKPHTHEGVWELALLLRGEGEVTTDDDIGPMTPGAVFAFRPGQHHGFKPARSTSTVAVQMYAPPGPEQRFLDLAGQK